MKNKAQHLLLLSCCIFLLYACSNSTDTTGTTGTTGTSGTTSLSKAFPSSFAVASPLQTSSSTTAAASSAAPTYTPSYASSSALPNEFSLAYQTDFLNTLLSATSASACNFDPSKFFELEINASCYGPTIDYTNHPDGTLPNSGQLPSGDVGMWKETEGSTTNACSAAQLNERMKGISGKAFASLSAAGSLLCVLNTSGLPLPSNSTETITTEMNTNFSGDVVNGYTIGTFSTATLTHSNSSGYDQYSYLLEFTVQDPSSTSHTIKVMMTHRDNPDAATKYKGKISFKFDDNDSGGSANACASGVTKITRAGSILYEMNSSSQLSLDARNSDFCTDSAVAFDGNDMVDMSDKLDLTSNPDGWKQNFNRFLANFTPSTRVGNYVFAWQAGPQDGWSRTFDVTLDNPSGSLLGSSYFGYGLDVADSSFDGAIDGFFCNWTGPGNLNKVSANLSQYVQYQAITENLSLFLFTATASNISYAPTNSCSYDGLGTFTWDQDGDTSTPQTGTAVSNGLWPITSMSFTAPTIPTPF